MSLVVSGGGRTALAGCWVEAVFWLMLLNMVCGDCRDLITLAPLVRELLLWLEDTLPFE